MGSGVINSKETNDPFNSVKDINIITPKPK